MTCRPDIDMVVPNYTPGTSTSLTKTPVGILVLNFKEKGQYVWPTTRVREMS